MNSSSSASPIPVTTTFPPRSAATSELARNAEDLTLLLTTDRKAEALARIANAIFAMRAILSVDECEGRSAASLGRVS